MRTIKIDGNEPTVLVVKFKHAGYFFTFTCKSNRFAMTSWSLEKELLNLTEQKDVRSALIDLDIINEDGGEAHVTSQTIDWERSGSEVYTYRFNVRQDNKSVDCIIKACVAFSPTGTLDNILNSWINKRTLLNNYDISSPKLFGYGKGIIIEEFIPFDLQEILIQNNGLSSILSQLALYAGIIAHLGFKPIDAFKDLRSRGSDVVVIDFGEDLGMQGEMNKESVRNVFEDLLAYLNESGALLEEKDTSKMKGLFDMVCKLPPRQAPTRFN